MGQDDVSNVVLSIIAAFASCRDVLRKVKQRRSKTPQRQHDQDHANESRLEHSLLLGPQEIDQCYRAGLSKLGHAFDRGDTPARTELTSVLLRLNAGLVDIIARFVSSPDPGKLHLDYAVLIQLSDTSRVQARRSLVALSQRLTKAVLTPGPDTWKAKQRDPANTDVNAAVAGQPRRHDRHKAIPKGECISISKQNHETQIALIRPRNKGTLSSESATSNKKKKGKSKTRTEHRPKTSTARPETVQAEAQRHIAGGRGWPIQSKTSREQALPAQQQSQIATRTRHSSALLVASHAGPAHVSPAPPASGEHVHATSPHSSIPSPRRRANIQTDTLYTMASDSASIGELPMRYWSSPFDYAEAERLNKEAEAVTWVAQKQKLRRQPGLLRRLFGRKGKAAFAVV